MGAGGAGLDRTRLSGGGGLGLLGVRRRVCGSGGGGGWKMDVGGWRWGSNEVQ